MTTLYLTQEEQELYGTLSQEMQNGWTTEEEVLPIEDSVEKRMVRFQLLTIQDPELQRIVDTLQKTEDVEALADAIADTDISGVSNVELGRVFFALGPVVLTKLIAYQLATIQSDEDVEGVAALSLIRHSILESIHSPSSI